MAWKNLLAAPAAPDPDPTHLEARKMTPVCGIDFGTSNSTATLFDHRGVQPLALDADALVGDTLPTLMFFPVNDKLAAWYGTPAVHEYLRADLLGRFVQSIKKHLPAPGFSGTVLHGEFRTIEDLVAGFLRHLKAAVDRAAGRDVRKVLLGRPARFHLDDDRDALAQRRLERAARQAGFDEVAFQIEPIAAARAFERSLDRDVLCLVGDLGGGTSDFTVIRLGPERAGRLDRRADVLGVAGVPVGGNDFDARLVWKKVTPHFGRRAQYRPAARWVPVPTTLHYAMCRWHTLSFASTPDNLHMLERMLRTTDDPEGLGRLEELIEGNYGFELFRSVEAAKVALSKGPETVLRFERGGVRFSEPVTRGEFEDAISGELGKLEGCIDELLASLSLAPADISVVFLTGGSSLVPAVARLFRARFGDRIVDRDVFTSVGLGLGIEAAERFASAA